MAVAEDLVDGAIHLGEAVVAGKRLSSDAAPCSSAAARKVSWNFWQVSNHSAQKSTTQPSGPSPSLLPNTFPVKVTRFSVATSAAHTRGREQRRSAWMADIACFMKTHRIKRRNTV